MACCRLLCEEVIMVAGLFSPSLPRDNNIEECGLEMYFAVDFEVLGEVHTRELIEGGKDVMVTEENKLDYLE